MRLQNEYGSWKAVGNWYQVLKISHSKSLSNSPLWIDQNHLSSRGVKCLRIRGKQPHSYRRNEINFREINNYVFSPRRCQCRKLKINRLRAGDVQTPFQKNTVNSFNSL